MLLHRQRAAGVLGSVRKREPTASSRFGAWRRRLRRRAGRRMRRFRIPHALPAVHRRQVDHLHRRAECEGVLVVTSRTAAAAVAMVLAALLSPTTARASSIEGMSVFLDPGHSGANDSSINSQVPNGRGGTKECQTTGTSTADGYAEHSFNWDVATRVRAALEQLGVHTAMSRVDDDSVGPCVDARAAAANALHPDADVSIHADGGPALRARLSRELFGAAAQRRTKRGIDAVGHRHARLPDRGRDGAVDVRRRRTVCTAAPTSRVSTSPSIRPCSWRPATCAMPTRRRKWNLQKGGNATPTRSRRASWRS